MPVRGRIFHLRSPIGIRVLVKSANLRTQVLNLRHRLRRPIFKQNIGSPNLTLGLFQYSTVSFQPFSRDTIRLNLFYCTFGKYGTVQILYGRRTFPGGAPPPPPSTTKYFVLVFAGKYICSHTRTDPNTQHTPSW
jgi:hypothetical protein